MRRECGLRNLSTFNIDMVDWCIGNGREVDGCGASEWLASATACVTTAALAPLAPVPSSVSVFRSRSWMLSIVFLQLMKRSKFSFTCCA